MLEKVHNRCGFSNGLCLSSTGHYGGVGLWWNELDISVLSFSPYHIHAVVLDGNKNPSWHAVGIYGWPETANKHQTWQLLRQVRQQYPLPLLLFGNFNEIVCMEEKGGGLPRSERVMDAFRMAVDDCGVKDMGYKGSKFTWQRSNSPSTLIRERLDRMLPDDDWCDLFPSWEVIHLPRYRSDHAPLLLKTGTNDNFRRGNKMFKFEARWLARDDCGKVVEDAWGASGGESIVARLELVSQNLSSWAAQVFGNLKRKKKRALARLNDLQQKPPDANILELCNAEAAALDEIHRLEESYWHARGRANEIRDGDKNTKYFHHKASQRKRRNSIHGMLDENGVWKNGREEIGNIVHDYFAELFASGNLVDMGVAVEGISTCVSVEMNTNLVAPPSGEEVCDALFAMHPNKAPGY